VSSFQNTQQRAARPQETAMKIHSTTQTAKLRTDRVAAEGDRGQFEAVRVKNKETGAVARKVHAENADGDTFDSARVRRNGEVKGGAKVETETGVAGRAYRGDKDSFELVQGFDNVKGHGYSGSSKLSWQRGEGATLEQQRTAPDGSTRKRSVELSGDELKAYLDARRLAAK
jgi:hypothetical protein